MRYGIRLLVRDRAFSLSVLVTLGIGIGLNATIFTVVDAVLLRPLPFASPSELVTVANPGQLINLSTEHPSSFLSVEQPTKSFGSFGIYDSGEANIGGDLVPIRSLVMEASPDFFTTLGIKASLGRVYEKSDEPENQDRLAVLSWSFWQSRYNRDPNVVGRKIGINGRNFTVSGVMPRGFEFPAYPGKVEVWVPLSPSEHLLASEATVYDCIARLLPGVSVANSQAEMDVIFRRLYPRSKDPDDPNRITVVPLHRLFEAGTRPTLLLLQGAAACVLLIICVNVASLSLARAIGRQQETAIRRVLGASRGRLLFQWFTEALLIALPASIVAILFTAFSLRAVFLIGSGYLRNTPVASVDLRILIFAITLSVGTVGLFGFAPALQFSNNGLSGASLSDSLKTVGTFNRGRIREFITVLEIALALVLLSGTGLMLRTFHNLWRIDPGFDATSVSTLTVEAPKSKYPSPAQKIAFYRQIIDRIREIPEVSDVGSANHLPLDSSDTSTFFAALRFSRGSGLVGSSGAYRVVSPNYFRTMGIPLLAGRAFTSQDDQQRARVAIINNRLAHLVFGEEDPIGSHVTFGTTVYEIVGIVGDIRHWGLDKEPDTEFFVCSLQSSAPFVSIVVKSSIGLGKLSPLVRKAVDDVDAAQPMYNLRPLDGLISETLSDRRFITVLMAIFSSLALFLSAVGIYGVVSYSTVRRTREIGVRRALGATRASIGRMVLGQAAMLAQAGTIIGILASLGLSRLLNAFLFGVKATDPITLLLAAATLLVVTLAACALPAWHASGIDPAIALRHE